MKVPRPWRPLWLLQILNLTVSLLKAALFHLFDCIFVCLPPSACSDRKQGPLPCPPLLGPSKVALRVCWRCRHLVPLHRGTSIIDASTFASLLNSNSCNQYLHNTSRHQRCFGSTALMKHWPACAWSALVYLSWPWRASPSCRSCLCSGCCTCRWTTWASCSMVMIDLFVIFLCLLISGLNAILWS